jgi:hypothetical protein
LREYRLKYEEINPRRTLFIFSYLSPVKTLTLSFSLKLKLPSLISLTFDSISDKTTTILFTSKPCIKSFNQLHPIILASSSIQKKDKIALKTFLFYFSLL